MTPTNKERGFLTEEELQALGAIKLENPNFALARDLFSFGCWTGISFIDIKNLTTDNIVEMNGALWIVSKRQKTGVPFQVKLDGHSDADNQALRAVPEKKKRLFNIGSLDMVNKRIKNIAKKCGIEKPVSFHQPPQLRCHGIELRYADRKREQDTRTYGHQDHANLCQGNEHETKNSDISAFENKISGRFDI